MKHSSRDTNLFDIIWTKEKLYSLEFELLVKRLILYVVAPSPHLNARTCVFTHLNLNLFDIFRLRLSSTYQLWDTYFYNENHGHPKFCIVWQIYVQSSHIREKTTCDSITMVWSGCPKRILRNGSEYVAWHLADFSPVPVINIYIYIYVCVCVSCTWKCMDALILTLNVLNYSGKIIWSFLKAELAEVVKIFLREIQGSTYLAQSTLLILMTRWPQGPLLLTWFNFNPSMDK